MRFYKDSKGITLITLIIMIIIIIILSVVSISAIFGKGNTLENSNNIVSKYNNKANNDIDYIDELERDLYGDDEKGIQVRIQTSKSEYVYWETIAYNVSIKNVTDETLTNIVVKDNLDVTYSGHTVTAGNPIATIASLAPRRRS